MPSNKLSWMFVRKVKNKPLAQPILIANEEQLPEIPTLEISIQPEYINTIIEHFTQVSNALAGSPAVKKFEKEYRLRPSHWIFLGISAIMVLILSHPAQFITEILGFLFPVSQSLRALETKTIKDDTQWLTYWVVFACINIIEPLVSWIPRYFTAKAIIIIWLLLPQTRGAEILYHKVIKVAMEKRNKKAPAIVLPTLQDPPKTVESVHRLVF